APCSGGAWTYTFSNPLAANGTYTVTATQNDAAGNTGTSGPKSITVQTSAPTVTVSTVNGATRTFPYTTSATVTTFGGTCTSAAGVNTTINVTISGASPQSGPAPCTAAAWNFTPTTAFSANGTYTVTATQSDTAGNTGTSNPQNIIVDKTAPIVSLTTVNGTAQSFPYLTNAVVTSVGGACGVLSGDSTTVNVSVAGAGSENGAATCAAGIWTYTFVSSFSANGAYTVTATQSDAAANTGTSPAQTITVDRTAPVITLTTVNGTVRTFPFNTNTNITTVGGGRWRPRSGRQHARERRDHGRRNAERHRDMLGRQLDVHDFTRTVGSGHVHDHRDPVRPRDEHGHVGRTVDHDQHRRSDGHA